MPVVMTALYVREVMRWLYETSGSILWSYPDMLAGPPAPVRMWLEETHRFVVHCLRYPAQSSTRRGTTMIEIADVASPIGVVRVAVHDGAVRAVGLRDRWDEIERRLGDAGVVGSADPAGAVTALRAY